MTGTPAAMRSEEHTSEPSHLVISYAVFCLKKKRLWVQAALMEMSTVIAEFIGAGLGLHPLFHGPLRRPGGLTGFIAFGILDFFFFNDTATTEIYTLSLHDALPI